MRRQARRGFTLIELLVVIGIIMVLVALLVYGYRAMNRTIGGKETHTELKVAKGMLAEYEGRNGLNGIESFAGNPAVQPPDPGAPPGGYAIANSKGFPVYADPAPAMGGANLTMSAPAAPGAPGTYWPVVYLSEIQTGSGASANGDMGDKSANSARYSDAVKRTLDVMYVLMRIPANQTHLQAIQSKRLLEQVPGTKQANTIQQGNVLLDGWGNPIIFVPRGGLHVLIPDRTSSASPQPLNVYVVRSTGSINLGPQGSPKPDPPLTGSERPFFASAGQDGDFTQGEDNLYSFQE